MNDWWYTTHTHKQRTWTPWFNPHPYVSWPLHLLQKHPTLHRRMQSAYHIHTHGTRLEITSPYTAQRSRSLCTFSFRENHNNTPLRITFFPLNPRNPQSRYVRISLCGGIVCAAKTSRNTSRMCSLCVHSSLHTINAQPNQFIQPCSHRKCFILHVPNLQLDCTKITGSLR